LGKISWKESIHLFHNGLEQVAPLAESLGVKILIEPEPELLIENSRQFTSFIRDTKSNAIGLNFDIGHFFCAGEDPSLAFEKLSRWVGHMHLEDIASNRVHNHLIAGHGAIQFLKIFKTLAKLKYQGDISLELYPYTNAPEAAGRESLDYLRPIFHEAGLKI
jgi:sugar phosphate isomerase/epimerase